MNDMLKYELKKYILKPSVIICLAVLLLVNLVKVLEIYCQGSGRQILFSGKGRIEISKDVLYEKYGGEITQEKIESLKAELAVAEQKLEEYGIIEEPIENTYTGYPYGDVNLIKDIISSYEYALLYTNTSNELLDRAAEKAAFYEGRNEYDKRESELYEYCFKGRAADSYIGNLIRIDNYLDSLEDHLSKLMLNLEKLREKEKDIRFELSKDESYTDQIETYKNKVKKLDKKLGVDKK